MRLFRLSLIGCYLASQNLAMASDYGLTGLIDIPTARMKPDATFSTSISDDQMWRSVALTYQAFPFLEASFRYSGLHVETGRGRFDNYVTWDRNFEAKARLLEESTLVPELAIGIRDLMGTGIFSGEYLVANKRVSNLDLTLGLGWGRLAGDGDFSNPLKSISDSFATRTKGVGRGGKLSINQWFSGDQVGVFAGASYDVPSVPIRLLAEYNPDTYSHEVSKGYPHPGSPFSYGVEWEALPGLTLGLSHQHGDRWGLALMTSLSTNQKPTPYQPKPAVKLEPLEIAYSDPLASDKLTWFEQIYDEAARLGMSVDSVSMGDVSSNVIIRLGRGKNRSWPDAIERLHPMLSMHLPESIVNVDYVVREAGLDILTVRMARVGDHSLLPNSSINHTKYFMPAREHKDYKAHVDNSMDDASFIIDVGANITVMDPDNPFGYQLDLNVGANVPLNENWSLIGTLGIPFYDNLDKNTRPASSSLPHVRSEVLQYLKQGDIKLESLYVENRGTLANDVHFRVAAGYLEEMYAGLSGEFLFQPMDSRLAWGLSGQYVKQREFDGGLDFLDYDVATGHASVYWATPFYNYDVALHLGRYLAKDVGGTVELKRTFDNGWALGAWATLTDVPFEEFGEGSFDKGIYLQVPLDGVSFASGNYKTAIRSIQRDGGQRIEDFSGTLWWDMRPARYDVFLEAQ